MHNTIINGRLKWNHSKTINNKDIPVHWCKLMVQEKSKQASLKTAQL